MSIALALLYVCLIALAVRPGLEAKAERRRRITQLKRDWPLKPEGVSTWGRILSEPSPTPPPA